MEVSTPLLMNALRAGSPTVCDQVNLSTYSKGSLAGSEIRRVVRVILKGILKEEFEQSLFGCKITWGIGGGRRASSKQRCVVRRCGWHARLGCLYAAGN